MSAANPIRLCMLGSEGAGKTCLLAGLAVLGEANRPGSFHLVIGDDRETQEYLNQLARLLRSQEWPPATNVTRVLRVRVQFEDQAMLLSILDFPGEDFRTALHQLDYQQAQELREHMLEADALLLVVDPFIDDLDPGRHGKKSPERMSPHESERRLERLGALTNSLSEIIKELRSKQTDGRGAFPDTAILLTKSDQLPWVKRWFFLRWVKRWRFLRRIREAPFYRTMKQLASHVRSFTISAVGSVAAETAGARPVPAPRLEPTGYEALFRWIVRRRQWSRRRPVLRRLARVVLPVLLVLGLVAGALWSQRAVRQEQVRTSDERAHRALDELSGQLESARTLADVRFVDQELEGLLSRTQDPSLKRSFQDLQKRARHKKEDLAYARVEDARSRGDWPSFDERAKEYLDELPSGARAEQIRGWSRERRAQSQEQDRQQVREVPTRGAAFLQRKARAILDYVQKYPDDPDVEPMRRAALLAQLLDQQRGFEVRLLSAGQFTKKREFDVVIKIEDREACRFSSGSAKTEATWVAASCTVQWAPETRIRVEIEQFTWLNAITASAESAGPLGIELLGGRRRLKAEPSWDESFEQEPYVHFRLEVREEIQWNLLHEYVYPGDRW
jgi:hypothetical protein